VIFYHCQLINLLTLIVSNGLLATAEREKITAWFQFWGNCW